MLRRLFAARSISSRRAKKFQLIAEENATKLEEPIPPTKECISMWRDGLPLSCSGSIHGHYKHPKLVELMSSIFDLVYKDVGIRLPKFKATVPQYRLYRMNEVDSKLNSDITDEINKLKYAINVHELRQKTISKTIHTEPTIANHCDDKYVFVDISPSKTKQNRAVLIRKPNGELDIADWDVRERMDVVFYGRDEQTYPHPSFTNSQIIRQLSPTELISVLSYITYFIPPDSPLYQNSVGECFETICRKKGFHVVASTHFLIPFIYHCLVFSNGRLLYLANSITNRSQEALVALAKAFAFVNKRSNTHHYHQTNPNNNTNLVQVFLDEANLIFNNSDEKQSSAEQNRTTIDANVEDTDTNGLEDFSDLNQS